MSSRQSIAIRTSAFPSSADSVLIRPAQFDRRLLPRECACALEARIRKLGASIRCHHGDTRRHRFKDGQAETLVERRQHQRACPGEQRLALLVIDVSLVDDVILQWLTRDAMQPW